MTKNSISKSQPNGTLALSATIAKLSGEELRHLLRSRRVVSPRSVQDPLGLAIELLRQESVNAALSTLDRATLIALVSLDAPPSTDQPLKNLRALGLVGLESASDDDESPDRVLALPEVSKALIGLGFGEVDNPAPAPTEAPPVDTSSWFGPAVASVGRAAALLRALDYRPARLSRKGAVTVVAKRELAATAHDDPERTGQLLHTLRLAGLATAATDWNGRSVLRPSSDAAQWLGEMYPERWLALASGLIGSLSPALRHTIQIAAHGQMADGQVQGQPSIDLSYAIGVLLEHEFPLLPEVDRSGATDWMAAAELIGLSVGSWLTPQAVKILNRNGEAALADARRDFPSTAAGIYLQPDLSLIVPSPLAPEDEATLNEIASTEQLEVATTMRLSPATLTRALLAGTEITEIRALLERLSLTGIPQPLDYLLSDLERKQKAGHLREPSHPHLSDHSHFARQNRQSARSRSTANDTSAAIDQALVQPGLDQPLSAELEELAERVEKAAHSSSGAGDLTRQLELAIRHRSTVRVTATARNQERTFTMLPVSLSGGRLRATDETAGVERTLPLTAIVAVEPL